MKGGAFFNDQSVNWRSNAPIGFASVEETIPRSPISAGEMPSHFLSSSLIQRVSADAKLHFRRSRVTTSGRVRGFISISWIEINWFPSSADCHSTWADMATDITKGVDQISVGKDEISLGKAGQLVS